MKAFQTILITAAIQVTMLACCSGPHSTEGVSYLNDPLGSSAGAVGHTQVLHLSEADLMTTRGRRMSSSGPVYLCTAKGYNDAVVILTPNSRLLVRDPSIIVSKIANITISADGAFWTQRERQIHVDFYFSFKNENFDYIRRVINETP